MNQGHGVSNWKKDAKLIMACTYLLHFIQRFDESYLIVEAMCAGNESEGAMETSHVFPYPN